MKKKNYIKSANFRTIYKKNYNKINFKGHKFLNKFIIDKVNYTLNLLTYKNFFNKNFIKILYDNKRFKHKKLSINKKIFLYNTKIFTFMLTSITSLSKKLGESYIKVPYIFFSNSLSYSSAKKISKKI
jgi:hypothetical protein